MKHLLMVMLAFIAFNSHAVIGTTDLLSKEELWENSLFVAVVQVTSGKFDRTDNTYRVSSDVVVKLKGEDLSVVEFTDSFPIQSPSTLGGYYLVYLVENGNGYATVRTDTSVVSLLPLDHRNLNESTRYVRDLGAPKDSIVQIDGKAWIVSECLSNNAACEHYMPVVRYAFNKKR